MQVDEAGGQTVQQHRKVGAAGAVSTGLQSDYHVYTLFLQTCQPEVWEDFSQGCYKTVQCLSQWMSLYGWGHASRQQPRCGSLKSSPPAFPKDPV